MKRQLVGLCLPILIVLSVWRPTQVESRAEEDGGFDDEEGVSEYPPNSNFRLARIVNGRNATAGAWNFMIKLIITSRDPRPEVPPDRPMISLCGGTVLNRFTILTAAHCFPPLDQLILVVPVIGSHHFMAGTKLSVADIVVHPEFSRERFCNDVALVRLAESVPEQYADIATQLPPHHIPELLRDECVTLGWGREGESKSNSEYLQQARVPLLSPRVCASHIPAGDHFDAKSMMCAGYLDGTRDACMGDSGGPLLCPTAGQATVWYQVGIISFGDGCARPGVPGYYARVGEFVDWIRDNMKRQTDTITTQEPVKTTQPTEQTRSSRRRRRRVRPLSLS